MLLAEWYLKSKGSRQEFKFVEKCIFVTHSLAQGIKFPLHPQVNYAF